MTYDAPTTLIVETEGPAPQSPPDTTADDRAQVIALHQKWWQANVGLDIPSMSECFPSGKNFSMFNRNSFTYFGLDEVTTLWRHYRATVPPRLTQTVAILRLEVRADTAWVISELTYRRTAPASTPRHWEVRDGEIFGSKATEIYHRDNGEGRPEWKMWHFQSGPLQPYDEPRPAFDDTLAQRGLGGNPYGEPLIYTVNLEVPGA